MKKTVNGIFCFIFLLMLLVPLLLTNTEEGAVSDVDGRSLMAMPKYESINWCSGIEKWLKDRLGMRDEIVYKYTAINETVFGELISSEYQYGKNGYTFFKIHRNIEYSDYQKQFAELISAMQKYCESRGSHFYYVFNPEKESIYRDHLPAGVNYDDSWVDDMLSYMEERGVNCIDLRNTLETESKSKDVFDRKNDAGHWNHNGAFYGMQEITKHLNKDMPEVKILEENEYEIYLKRENSSNNLIDEAVPVYIPKEGYTDITGDLKKEITNNKSHTYFQLIQNDSDKASAIRRLLLFEDDLFAPFAFIRSEETAVVSCMQNAINFDYYYNIFKPDVVIFESMEYVIKDRFFSQSAMEAANYNPAILENYPEERFQERRDQLLWQTEEIYTDAAAVLIPGKAVDKVFISSGFDNLTYAYLITDDKVLDLKKNKSGALTASVRHGDLTEGSYVVLYLLNENGEGRFARIPVGGKMQNVAHRESSSGNTTYDRETRKYIMTGYVKDDPFRYTALLLYNENGTEQIDTIGATSNEGLIDGGYCHKLPTGDYMLILRAGRKLTTERAVFKVHLIEGMTYWFRYNVDELSDMEVVISEFKFSKH